jgi:mannose-1-phosphate guanylyltransferase
MTWVVILAGGIGERLWPLSSSECPKQCARIFDGESLLQRTVQRAKKLAGVENILVVTGPTMETEVRSQVAELPVDNVLVEPKGKNTGPAIAWASRIVAQRGGEVLVVWPSDHWVGDEGIWLEDTRRAVDLARGSRILLLGVRPSSPATQYGYIEMQDAADVAQPVVAFVEKPDVETAQRYLAAGNRLWNCGVLVASVPKLEEEITRQMPAVSRLLDASTNPPPLLWDALTAISFDHAVLEHSPELWVVPTRVKWNDLGGWETLLPFLEDSGEGDVLRIETTNCSVFAQHDSIALLGTEDLLVIQYKGKLLIAKKGSLSLMRKVAKHWKEIEK